MTRADSYSKSEVELLIYMFETKFGLTCTLRTIERPNNVYYRIYITAGHVHI